MNRTYLLALFLSLGLLASAQTVTLPYNPDANADSAIGAPDLLQFLPLFGGYFTPSEVMVDDQTLTQYIDALQLALEEANADTVPLPMLPGTAPGEMLYWDGVQWTLLPVGDSGNVLYLDGATPTWTPFSLELFGIQLTLGCTDTSACNFQGATIEDGTCQYFDACGICNGPGPDSCGVCGGPGAIYACGCSELPQGDCDCQGNVLDAIGNCGGTCSADADGDGICDDVDDCVGAYDATGVCEGDCTVDEDADGICDDLDLCTDLSACNFGDENNAVCVYTEQGCSCGIEPDAIGVCGGFCLSDVDGDGICDDVDLCSDTTACNYSLGNVEGPCMSLRLDVHTVHTSGTLAGQTTYRLYVVLQNSTDFLSAINGDGSTPLAISTTTSFHQDAFGAPASSGISSALLQLQFFPDLIYDSYVTIGHSPEDGPAVHDIIMVNSPSQNWVAAFEAGGDIVMDDAVGGLWAIYNEGNAQGLPDASGKVLIAQLTTDGAISVILGAQVFPDFGCCSNGSANGDGEWRPYPVELSTICSINEECLFEDECGVCGGFGTDVDADGICDFVEPVEFDGHTYAVVEIGDQCWFAENLRTTVYGNGDVIPAGLSDGEWTSTTAGATAVYGEGISYCANYSPEIDACDEAQSLAAYGRLYNWYAVDDARGLCPVGWHVPTDGEWTELEDYITSEGFAGTEGTALKSTTGWYDNGNGTDDFGFSALPGSYRGSYGYFNDAGIYGRWWSSSPSGGFAWFRDLRYSNPAILRSDFDPRFGFSVRCLRDAD